MKKRGISPVIATVLLVGMVIVLALIVFLWFRGMTEETVTKFGGENVKLVCSEVIFDASYSNGNLYVSNTGNIPLFSLKIKLVSDASRDTSDVRDLSENWPAGGLNQGATFSGNVGNYDEIVLTPVLLGNSDSGEKTYVCDESNGLTLTA